jgi:succinoglycan biosynthesis protein ExoM
MPHITVCICTFKRAAMLPELLRRLDGQQTHQLFTFDVVFADNDSARSAEQTVATLAKTSPVALTYCVEPEQNFARARNTALANAKGDLVAFIDDDELPVNDWLLHLFRTRLTHHADAVLGPVLAQYEQTPPAWVKKGGFFDRPRHQTGTAIAWPEARTGNVLLGKEILSRIEGPFLPQFGSGGEDVDFFRRLSAAGCTFVWCDEAVADERVPAHRCTLRFLAGRALLRGTNFPKQGGRRATNILKSLVAVPSYTLALPVLALVGRHLFVAYAVKLLEHTSRLLAVAGMPLSVQREH